MAAMNLTLRTKGILALAILILYVGLISWFLAYARQDLYVIVQQIESNYSKQALLDRTFKILAHTLVETQTILTSLDESERHVSAYGELYTHMEPIRGSLAEARRMYPLLRHDTVSLEQAIFAVGAQPNLRHLSEVRDSEQRLIVKLQDILTALQQRNAELAQTYHKTQQFISVVSVSANIVGAVASAAVILVFFTRLAADIKRLQNRAVAIVGGYSGKLLVNTRRDEVGGLIDAVNRMQVVLRRWERQQEITRAQRVHQEKMAAVGSLAAAIGHEVSNPIAAIAGVARVIMDETLDENASPRKGLHDLAAQIFKEAQRIALIMRQMSTLTRPHSPHPELLDLNALIQSTCSFMRYDKRFRDIEFAMDLDPGIPAVTAIADHVTQILMNLFINAADAMDGATEPGCARIRISTRLVGSEVQLEVADTGHGMSPDVLARAFQESFTTKPAGKGRGIGLFLCKSLINEGGGRIELASAPGAGTTAKLSLPLSKDDGTAA